MVFTPDGLVALEHVAVDYGGGFRAESVFIQDAAPEIRSLAIRHSRVAGLRLDNASPVIVDSVFANNADAGVVTVNQARPAITQSAFEDNGRFGLQNTDLGVVVDAASNY